MDNSHGTAAPSIATRRGAHLAGKRAFRPAAMCKLMVRVAAAGAITLVGSMAWADPPGRAGRLSALEGSATLQQGDAEAGAAALNWPITAGERLVTAPGSRLELRVGSTALQLDADSTLDIDRLDDERLDMRLEHGRAALQVLNRDLAAGTSLATPQGRTTMQEAGRWRFEAGLSADTTSVAAVQGAAAFTGSDDAATRLSVPAGRVVRITGTQTLSTQAALLDAVDFDRWVAERDQHAARPRSSQTVSAEMTGADDLDNYGSWAVSAEYGSVWYPTTVEADWAPYRHGRWAWVAPWGWTWVDAAPWGFAPFHYGRWAYVGGRWGWAPGSYVAAPVYAPALVGWIGRPGWSVSVSVGASVGWFPLAPNEPYVPAYRVSPAYVRNVNITNVRDVTRISNVDATTIRYANRNVARAVTVVPSAAMTGGHDVARAAVPIKDAQALAALPPATREPAVQAPPRAELAAHTLRAAGPNSARGPGGPTQPGSAQARPAETIAPTAGGRAPRNDANARVDDERTRRAAAAAEDRAGEARRDGSADARREAQRGEPVGEPLRRPHADEPAPPAARERAGDERREDDAARRESEKRREREREREQP
jgi:hypothetical protein